MASRTRSIRKIAAAAAGTLLTLLPSACTSSATTNEPFAGQARAAHLTSAQDRALRAEVVKYQQSSGGTQISLNEIDLYGTGKIKVAIPGEAHPRDFVNNPTAVPSSSDQAIIPSSSPCYGRTGSGYFCGFSGVNYTGSESDMRMCSTSYLTTFLHADALDTGSNFRSWISDLADHHADWMTTPC